MQDGKEGPQRDCKRNEDYCRCDEIYRRAARAMAPEKIEDHAEGGKEQDQAQGREVLRHGQQRLPVTNGANSIRRH